MVGAPAVSDALTQGTANAGYSLASRDLMADCVETGHCAHHANAMIVISGCDKTGAAALMPLARTNAFGLVIYPGTSSPGRVDFGPWAAKGNNLTIMDYAEGAAAQEAGRISTSELEQLQQCVMPGSGTCGAMFTANTMSTIAEAMGMMLTRGASHPADHDASSDVHEDVRLQIDATVDALYRLMETGLRPRDIMTMQAFVARFPAVDLSCLPHMQEDYRETELGVRGTAGDVAGAADWLTDALDEGGWRWHKRAASRATGGS